MLLESERHISMQREAEFNSKYKVKEYTSDDKGVLLAAYDQLRAEPRGIATLRSRFDVVIPRDRFEAFLDNLTITYRALVFEESETLAGWGEYFVDKRDSQRAELSRLVMPDFQGKGIGTQLIKHLLKRCKALEPNVQRLESLTSAGNILAIGSLTSAIKECGGYRTDERSTDQIRFTFPL